MYKKGVKSMPRSIKKELLRKYQGAFNSIDAIKPLVYPGSYFDVKGEQSIVSKLSSIRFLPSYWIVTSTNPVYSKAFWLIFESKLHHNTEIQLQNLEKNHPEFDILNYYSASEYYGIY